jgi:hypothetical protein
MRARWLDARSWRARGEPPLGPDLRGALAIGLREATAPDRARAWADAVLAAEREWTADFGGEQFALGRAFYTHLETGRSASYFGDAAASDARVERVVPGMQAFMRELASKIVGAPVRPRRGFCGAGIHVFPPREKASLEGGVVHFDLEGLTPRQLARMAGAITIVVMLQPPSRGGGLHLWDVRWEGRPEPDPAELPPPATMRSRAGDCVVLEAYRLHQIARFGGRRARVSATLHAAEIDPGIWESWF